MPTRRHLLALGPLAMLAGCAAPWPRGVDDAPSASAAARLRESAHAHGAQALSGLHDINLAFDGEWGTGIQRIQPALVDEGFRKTSEERLLPALGVMAQRHRGPQGRKQVLRQWQPGQTGTVRLAYNGQPDSTDTDLRDAAAVVCDAYRIFVLGPMVLANREPDALNAHWGEPTEVDGQLCDVVHLQLRPGLGFAAQDRLALYISRSSQLMRRVRFSINALPSTAGAVVEVDLGQHLARHGVLWPTHYVERLIRPIPNFHVHEWRLTGLDVNRGYGPEALAGPAWAPEAERPAAPLQR